MVLKLLVLAGVFLMGGCAAPSESPPLTPDHPASVDAPDAPYAPSPSVLAEDRTDPPSRPVPQPASPESGHEQHGISPLPAVTPGVGAMTTGKQSVTQQATYTCPMHPEVVQNIPGRCPKCGMALVKKPEQPMGEHHD